MTKFSFNHILEARKRIDTYINHTPVITSRTFNSLTKSETFFKCENFQRGGSFKARGASNRLALLSEEEQHFGVVAFSLGNHAQGVAIAARDRKIPATIVIPTNTSKIKVSAIIGYGAKIVYEDPQTQNREEIAKEIAKTEKKTLIPPFNDYDVMAGQGTICLEFFEEVKTLDILLVPVGGGGLISGCSVVAKKINPKIKIYGVEPEEANDVYLSIQAGKIITITHPKTIADGIRTNAPGELNFEVMKKTVDEILLVKDHEILEAMNFLLYRMKLLVEPAGAAGVAAILTEKLKVEGKRVGVILSGGNVDGEILTNIL